jgi:hypothetical protein
MSSDVKSQGWDVSIRLTLVCLREFGCADGGGMELPQELSALEGFDLKASILWNLLSTFRATVEQKVLSGMILNISRNSFFSVCNFYSDLFVIL